MAQIIKKIVIKLPLNFDRLAALFILGLFGQVKYQGLGTAEIGFLGSDLPADQMAIQQNQGVLFLGFTPDVILVERLVEILAINEDPVIKKIKNFIQDQNAVFKMADSLIKRQTAHPERAVLSGLSLLKTSLTEEAGELIWQKEFERISTSQQISEFTCYQGKKLIQAVAVISELSSFDLWLLNKTSPLDLVAQKSSQAMVISARLEKQIELDNLTALLRIEEARKKRLPFDSLDKKQLFASGQLGTILEWHYAKSAGQIISGDGGAIKTPMTILSFEEVQEYIKVGLNPVLVQEKYPKFF